MSTNLFSKNFTILIVGQIISLFGSSIQRFAMSLYVLDLTGSATIFATILAISIIPIILVSPLAGSLADRLNKKKLMILLDVLSGSLLLVYLVVVTMNQDNIVLITFIMVMLSTLTTLYQPVVNTCVPLIVADEELVRGNAVIQQVTSLSNFLGPLFAGILYGFFGISGVIMINAVSFLISAGLEVWLTLPSTSQPIKSFSPTVFLEDMRESYDYLKGENKVVFRMLVTAGLYNMFLVPIFSVVTPYLIRMTYELSAQVYGISEAFISLGMIIGGGIIASRPHQFQIKMIYKPLYGITLMMFLMAISVFLFHQDIYSSQLAVIIFTTLGMLIMAMLGIANVLSSSYLYQAIKPSLLGKVMAFSSAFATLCVPMGQLIFGGLIELIHGSIAILILLATVSVGGVTYLVQWNVNQIKQ